MTSNIQKKFLISELFDPESTDILDHKTKISELEAYEFKSKYFLPIVAFKMHFSFDIFLILNSIIRCY